MTIVLKSSIQGKRSRYNTTSLSVRPHIDYIPITCKANTWVPKSPH